MYYLFDHFTKYRRYKGNKLKLHKVYRIMEKSYKIFGFKGQVPSTRPCQAVFVY